MMKRLLTVLVAATLPTAASATDIFSVTYEAAGVQNSTATFATKGVETFEGRSTGANQTFGTSFGTNGVITGTYTGVQINGADAYGSAGGSGNHAVTYSGGGYALDLATTDARGINYFGFWLSALDSGNTLTFQRGGQTVFSFTADNVRTLLASRPGYAGNPNNGANMGEPYAFLNFYDTTGTFDRVLFTETPQVGGYESDNHTVGFFTAQTGTPAVPEPATWAMMIGGFGLVGLAMRRRRRAAAVIA